MTFYNPNISKHPNFLQIETTTSCNARCSFCPQKKSKRNTPKMSDKLIKKIITDSRNLGITYRPFLLNEPLTDKRITDVVKFIKLDQTARVELNSNGELLNATIADKLIDSGIDLIKFSIDGFSRQTILKNRGLDRDKIYNNVTSFIKKNKNANLPIDIIIRMIKNEDTIIELNEFEDFWSQLGANIEYTKLYRYPWEGQKTYVKIPCKKIVDEMFIYSDGRVSLCCWDTAGRQIVGSIQTQNTIDVWNSAEMRRCRNLLAKGLRHKLELCRRCDAYIEDYSGNELNLLIPN